MVFKITSIKHKNLRRRAGMTLMELLVSVAILSVVLGVMAALIFYIR